MRSKNNKLWAIPSGKSLVSTKKPNDTKLLAVLFVDDITTILSTADDKFTRHPFSNTASKGEEQPASVLAAEQSKIKGRFLNIPTIMSFAPDVSQDAVARRGYPSSVWTTNESRLA